MSNRTNIYYWKCDRPEAFATLGKQWCNPEREQLEADLDRLCRSLFGDDRYRLEQTFGQGNHRNYKVRHKDRCYFIRVENSHDCDDYMIVETEVIRLVSQVGVPVPRIYTVDASRSTFPFAFQVMDCFPNPDINGLYKKGELDTTAIMRQLGGHIARWQTITTDGFGLFNTDLLRSEGVLRGLSPNYPDYYRLNLDNHLDFLSARGFISPGFAAEIRRTVEENASFLELDSGCLVHKDIAFWNLLGTRDRILSVIDWDDTIMGDPTDDLSLMACYHCWQELQPLFDGYSAVRPLPDQFEKRFWLHLLRNILFKAVIRVGAGYFNKDLDFFLVQSEQGGSGLKTVGHGAGEVRPVRHDSDQHDISS